jgi:hypothetical protein
MPRRRPKPKPTAKSDYKYVYLEYLDKEMSILGILSAFCVAVVGLFVQQVGTAQDKVFLKEVLDNGYWYLISGSILVLLSAGLFYHQRAELAWYYGQMAKAVDFQERQRVEEYIQGADYWSTWLPYFIGFKSLNAGMILYILALVSKHLHFQLWIVCVTIAVFGVWAALEAIIYIKYPQSDTPFRDFFHISYSAPVGGTRCAGDKSILLPPKDKEDASE